MTCDREDDGHWSDREAMSAKSERLKNVYHEMLAVFRGKHPRPTRPAALPEDERDEIRHAAELAARITRAFELATADAARAHTAARVPTVGCDERGNIVRREPDGAKTIIVRAEDHLPAGKIDPRWPP